MQRYNRRQFLEIAAAGTGALATACNLDVVQHRTFTHEDALIAARPITPTIVPTTGYSALGLSSPRDGFMYVPTTYNPATAAPLLVLLHENGGSAQFWQTFGIGELLDDLGIVILAPDSRRVLWDISAERGYSTDPKFFNTALTYLFQRCKIDSTRIALGGYSDGGMEALGVGIANGSLFSHVLAYAPGTLLAPWTQGKPKLFISHGELDTIQSFGNDRDFIVPRLRGAGYDVTFVSFDGAHELPTAIARQSATWFLT